MPHPRSSEAVAPSDCLCPPILTTTEKTPLAFVWSLPADSTARETAPTTLSALPKARTNPRITAPGAEPAEEVLGIEGEADLLKNNSKVLVQRFCRARHEETPIGSSDHHRSVTSKGVRDIAGLAILSRIVKEDPPPW